MEIRRLVIQNFRGIRNADLLLPKHAVLVGDNNVGKTTILEAIDLTLGPDRLNRFPPIDEHDFFESKYLPPTTVALQGDQQAAVEDDQVSESARSEDMVDLPQISIEVTITGLSEEQSARFADFAEWWDTTRNRLYTEPDPTGVDADSIRQALRVTFQGSYEPDEDDFQGKTYFTRTLSENDHPVSFGRKEKQACGFLYLRSLRTGARALSLERGSLLDIILRLKEVRPQMWESTLRNLAALTVASDPALGVSAILESISNALKKYVPKDWGVEPHLKASNLTRDHLRRFVTAFVATGVGGHAAPFDRQGRGTINVLVLAMLSLMAQDRQNVIFAMEEPETAIPPYAQKRIVHELRTLSSQAILTSHSPYVLEEFRIEETVVLSRHKGTLRRAPLELPDNVKLKRYRQEFRTRFCEGLLASRILLAEGTTEATAFPTVARRLSELRPGRYASLEALGVCTIDAGGDSNIIGLARLYRSLGKYVVALCDRQPDAVKEDLEKEVDELFMHEEVGFEDLVLNNVPDGPLERAAAMIDWPERILSEYPDQNSQLRERFRKYFRQSKGNWGVAEFLAQCTEEEIPTWIRATCTMLQILCSMSPEQEESVGMTNEDDSAESAENAATQ